MVLGQLSFSLRDDSLVGSAEKRELHKKVKEIIARAEN